MNSARTATTWLSQRAGRAVALAATLGLSTLAGGCTGIIHDNLGAAQGASGSGGAASLVGPDSVTTFTCDPTLAPPMDQLRALTTSQYQNTLSDLAAWALNSATTGATVMTEVASAMTSLPGNSPVIPSNSTDLAAAFPDGGWLRADQDIQFTRLQSFYGIGQAVAQSLTSSTAAAP